MTTPPPYPDAAAILAAMDDPNDGNALRQAVASRVGMLAVRLSATIIANRAVPVHFKVPAPQTPLDRVAIELFTNIIENNPSNPKILIDDGNLDT